MKNFYLLAFACLALTVSSCSQSGSDKDSSYVSVQLEDSKMWSLLDVKKGKIVMADEFFAPSSNVVKGSFFVENDNKEFDLYNLKDTKNKLNRSSYTIITNFNRNGFAITRVKDEPWQIIDTQGNTIATLDKNLSVLSGFSDEGAALIANSDKLLGFVNTQGEEIIKPRYKYATIFSDGVAFVLTKEQEGHYYFSAIDLQGNTLFSFTDAKYSDVGLFQNGYMFAVEGDHIVLIDKTGKKIMNVCSGNNISALEYNDGKVIYYDGQFYGVKNLEDKILIRAKYQSLSFQSNGQLIAKNSNNMYGVINSNDDIIMPFDYNTLYYIAVDRYITKSGSVYVMIDTSGKEICDKAFSSFSDRGEAASEYTQTALISSQNNEVPVEETQNFLLNLENFDTNFYLDHDEIEYSEYIPDYIIGSLEMGENIFDGHFLYDGGDYPFEIKFNYNPTTHAVSNPIYIATGTGSTNQITSMTVTSDETGIIISGPGLELNADMNEIGGYSGYMTRGSHSGPVVMYLK